MVSDEVQQAMDALRSDPEYLINTIMGNNLPAVCERLRVYYNRQCTSPEDVMANVRDLVKGYPTGAMEIIRTVFSVPIDLGNLSRVGEDVIINSLITHENAATTR